tara:strand:+ start:113 stop:511 length:399 start_codon:yes stop_codon:yes gene_type:complete
MYKKVLLAGFIILIFGMLTNWLIGFILPGLMLEYQNTAIFRPWNDPLMIMFFGYPFILSYVLYHLWGMVNKQFKGDVQKKAFAFAKLYFIIATIPGMFITYTSFQLSFSIIISWTVIGFVQAFVAGYVFAKK